MFHSLRERERVPFCVLIYERIRVALLHRDLDRNNHGDGLGPTIPLPTRKLHTTLPCLPSANRVG